MLGLTLNNEIPIARIFCFNPMVPEKSMYKKNAPISIYPMGWIKHDKPDIAIAAKYFFRKNNPRDKNCMGKANTELTKA
jgi:hypothetical protein